MKTTDQLDEVKINAIFPTEIWFIILGLLSCFKDYRNISAAAEPFQRILLSLRNTVLFSDAIKAIYRVQRKRPQVMEQFLFSYGKLRRECSSWRHGVNGLYDSLHSTFFYGGYIYFFKVEHFIKFHKYFGDANRSVNPFRFRSAKFGIFRGSFLDPRRQFVGNMLEILRKFGHHIWYCEMYVSIALEQLQEFLNVLPEMLEAMPHLRCLKLEHHNVPLVQEKNIALVEEALPTYQFPKLKHLWWLDTGHIAPSVVEQLLRSNPQIRVVYGSQYHWYLERLPNLEQLFMRLDNLSEFARFRNFRVVSPLRKLELKMRFPNLPWSAVLPTLAYHFGKTLAELKLEFAFATLQKTSASMESVLPFSTLKTVTVVTKHAVGLDFLLPLRKYVENLSIMISKNDPAGFGGQTENVIKLYQFDDQFKNSNIWRWFDNLSCLRVQFYPRDIIVCTKKLVENEAYFEQYTVAGNLRRL